MKSNLDSDITIHALIEINEKFKQACDAGHYAHRVFLTYRKHLMQKIIFFKACVCYVLPIFYFSPNDSPSKTMKNVFYFI